MEKDELIEKLLAIPADGDKEGNHYNADQLLLDYINDDAVSAAYNRIGKWYA